MSAGTVRNPQIAEEAADWAVTLDAGEISADQRQALADWLLESPRHVEELLLAASIYTGFEDVDPDKTRSIDALLAATAPEVVPLLQDRNADGERGGPQKPKPRRHLPRFALAAIAAVLLVGISIGLWPTLFPGGTPTQTAQTSDGAISEIATQLGEQRSITLDDGSIVHLNTQSEIAIRYEQDARVIELVSGEALFDVARDPNRPFRVIAGETTVEAVGTTFNVYREGDRTTVAVIEGEVAVDAGDGRPPRVVRESSGPAAERLDDGRLLLSEGEKAEVAMASRSVRLAEANVDAVSSWRMRQLVFEDDTLFSIAQQFNRYNRTQVVVEDIALANTRFSGVFDADDPQSLIAFLQMSGDVSVDRSNPNELRLSARDN